MPTKVKISENKKIPKLRFPGFSGVWKQQTLGEIGKIVTGTTPKTSKREYYDGKFLFVSPTDFNSQRYIVETKTTCTKEGYAQARNVKNGSVLFVCIGSTIGKIAQAGRNCITNQQINSVVANDKNSNDFIYFNLLGNAKEISLLAGRQAVPIINKTEFEKIKISLPSILEQQKIADFLGSVDAWIENLQAQKESFGFYKKGMMQKIFAQGVRFKDDNGKSFPKWTSVVLQDVVSRFATGLNPRDNFKLGEGNNYYVTIKNINAGKLYFDSCERVDNDALQKINNRSDLKVNDIIFSSIGNIGESYLIEEQPSNWNINESVFSLRPLAGKILPKFLYYIIANQDTKRHFINSITGSSFKSIKMKELRLTPLKLPCIPEQQKIAEFLTSIDKIIESKQQQIAQAEQWKKGLMQGLFV